MTRCFATGLVGHRVSCLYRASSPPANVHVLVTAFGCTSSSFQLLGSEALLYGLNAWCVQSCRPNVLKLNAVLSSQLDNAKKQCPLGILCNEQPSHKLHAFTETPGQQLSQCRSSLSTYVCIYVYVFRHGYIYMCPQRHTYIHHIFGYMSIDIGPPDNR